jgi:protein-L-isoaspartate(D-aspartate) O-methyltransferase
MPTCPECGLDVQKEGLCAECKASKNSRGASASKQRTSGKTQKPGNFIFKIGFAILFLIIGFFIGWTIFAKPFALSQNNSNIETKPDNDSQINAAESSDSGDQQDKTKTEAKSPAQANEVLVSDNTASFSLESRKEKVPLTSKEAYITWMTGHTKQESEFLSKRWDCAQTLITWSKSKSITQERVFDAFLRTPREYFCRENNLPRVYDFTYLDIGWGQTISGPEIVARMTNALNPQPEHKTLEIGTGSGYQSAFLSELSNHVYTIEIIEPLAKVTDTIYKSLIADYPEYNNVHRKIADGYYGWEENAPFDRIIVTCGIDHIPPPLLKQLAPEGIMVIPVGPPSGQTILKITKHIDEKGNIALDREDIYTGTTITKAATTFVPFKASDGSTHSTVRDINE